MIWTVPVSSKGQITLPAPVRRKFKLSSGRDRVLVTEENEKIVIKPLSRLSFTDLYGIVEVRGKKPVDIEAEIEKAKQAMAKRVAKEGLE